MPAASDETVALVPEPFDEMPPGYLTSIHSSFAGRFSRTTLPVARSQVGCVIVPITGAGGVTGCALITNSADAGETHPAALATVKVQVPALIPVTVRVDPVPVTLKLPGKRVRVHVPEAGRPLSATLPVESAQVGRVMAPITGAPGVSGCALITTFPDAGEIQPSAFVTVKL